MDELAIEVRAPGEGEPDAVSLESSPVDSLVAETLPFRGEVGDLVQELLDGRAGRPAPKARGNGGPQKRCAHLKGHHRHATIKVEPC